MTSKDRQRWEKQRQRERCSSHLYSWKNMSILIWMYGANLNIVFINTDHILFGSEHQLCILNRHQCSSDLYRSETSKFTDVTVCLCKRSGKECAIQLLGAKIHFSHLNIWDSLFTSFYCWVNIWFPFNSIWWRFTKSHIKQPPFWHAKSHSDFLVGILEPFKLNKYKYLFWMILLKNEWNRTK